MARDVSIQEFPKLFTMASANRIAGKAKITSLKRTTKPSSHLPKKPPKTPNKTPINPAIPTATIETVIERLIPSIALEKTSRPN